MHLSSDAVLESVMVFRLGAGAVAEVVYDIYISYVIQYPVHRQGIQYVALHTVDQYRKFQQSKSTVFLYAYQYQFIKFFFTNMFHNLCRQPRDLETCAGFTTTLSSLYSTCNM